MVLSRGSGKQQASFLLIGALNTCIAFLLFSLFILFFSESINVLVISILVSAFSYVSGYYLYKRFVWSKTRVSAREFYRFIRSNLIFLSINLFSLHIFVNVLDFAAIIVQLITTGSLVVVSFLVHNNWTFSQKVRVLEETNFSRLHSEK